MKAIISPLTALALFLGISAAFAENSAILIRVEQNNKSDMNPKDRAAKTETQTHVLKVHLTNSSPNPADLKVKYTYFGRDMQSHDVVVINSGEQTVAVKPNGEAVADIPPVTSTSIEAHFQGGGKGKVATKVDASGSKFIGYGVQIFAGNDIVAEAFEPLSMKDEIGKAAPAAKPGTAPKPAATPAKK